MIKVNFTSEFENLKSFYSCGKCKTQDLPIPILLRTCRHIFCTKCLIIQGKQHCPQCSTLYTALDIDRGHKFTTNILKVIKSFEQTFPETSENTKDNRYSIECDQTNVEHNAAINNIIKLFGNICNNNDNILKEVSNIENKENNELPVVNLRPKRKQSLGDLTGTLKRVKQEISNLGTHKTVEEVTLKQDSAQASNSNDLQILLSLDDIDAEFRNVKLCREPLKRNGKGETPLHLACKKLNTEKVKELIDSGMDVNCVDWSNWTPLHESVEIKHKNSIQLLLDAGCLVNVPSLNYTTPLHRAIEINDQDIIDLLISHGADPDLPDITGITPKDNDSNLNQIIQTGKTQTLVFNCDSSKCGPKVTQSCEIELLGELSVTNGMEYLSVEFHDTCNLFQPIVMAALLKAVPIIKLTDVPTFLKCENMAFLTLIPNALQNGYKKVLRNRLYRLPALFDGMNFHLHPKYTMYTVKRIKFSREQIQGLIGIAGGTVLKRAPSESTVAGVNTRPFHARSTGFNRCAHYILYNQADPPLLRYNMPELKHVTVEWLLNCIWNFEILCDS